jgi:putative nucleotidyltransferase with HDIG domain
MSAFWGRLNLAVSSFRRERIQSIFWYVALAVLAILFLMSGTALVGFKALVVGNQTLTLDVGEVAPNDIRAPFSISYESTVMTNQRIEIAMNSVREIYDPPDPSIARQQVQLARQILDYIADVRADEYGTPEVLKADIRAISAITLQEDDIEAILATSPERWTEIDQQIITVLERAMREEIREDNLLIAKQNVPNLVSVRFREDEVTLITAIIENLIQTNTFYNEERTREARQIAADSVAPEIRSFVQGQLVVRDGAVVSEVDMEALTQLGLLQPEDRRAQELLSALLLILLIMLLFGLYLNRFHPQITRDASQMILLGTLFILVLAGARLAGPDRVVQPYVYPSAALGLLFATLVGPQVAIVGTVLMAVLIGLLSGGALSLTMMSALGGIVGVLTLRNTERLNSYFVSGLLIGFTNASVVVVFYLDGYPADPLGALTLIGAGLINGVLAGVVALAGLYLISGILNLSTSLRLIELTQPGQRLLQRLLREAPGTYQHSLQVANLAELAAERVGANVALTRVGALYHDVGKMMAPHFFIENQVDGVNPHDGLNNPYKSARIIIDHVIEGEKLARKYRLPARVRDFILEHHGTTQPGYFYRKAVEQNGGDEAEVDKSLFTYPGPRPRTPETAILMLADSCESTVRARRPQNKQEIADAVKYIFETRMSEGQLDDSGLTLRDLSVIQRVFVESLQGVFHPRIAYSRAATPDTPETFAMSVVDAEHAGDESTEAVASGLDVDDSGNIELPDVDPSSSTSKPDSEDTIRPESVSTATETTSP